MPWYAFLLAPFALLFRLVTEVRNFFYDFGILKSQKSSISSLVVGNLSIGGTGKTPHVEFLINQFQNDWRLATLSRGYGRKTKGFLQAQHDSQPMEIGDEPLQLFQKFKGMIPVFVCEDRVLGIEKIKNGFPEIELVILDDAFQHRRLKADFNILLTPYSKPFIKDYLLPMGRLRESRKGARRADLLIVTKCPETISLEEKMSLRNEMSPFLPKDTRILFSGLRYGNPYSMSETATFSKHVILISGLADDRLFVGYSSQHFNVLEIFSFPDHHDYTIGDQKRFLNAAITHEKDIPVFLCTEKDFAKLNSLGNGGFLGDFPIFALPIEVTFESEERDMLLNQIRKKITVQ
jgi:tetraacyldisaccharide 4'-kinase